MTFQRSTARASPSRTGPGWAAVRPVPHPAWQKIPGRRRCGEQLPLESASDRKRVSVICDCASAVRLNTVGQALRSTDEGPSASCHG